EAHLERNEAGAAKIKTLGDFTFLPIPEMDVLAVLAGFNIVELESRLDGIRRSPFAGNHDVVSRLIPKVVVVLHALFGLLPRAHDFKLVIEQKKTAWSFAFVVAEHGNHDRAVRQAMNG